MNKNAILFPLYSIIKILLLLIGVFINSILKPRKMFAKRIIYPAPPCLSDTKYGNHSYIQVNGIKLHCVVSGPKGAPLMIMLHGFPELWYSWRHQISEFNKDFYVVAVDMRGYGESDKPNGLEQYSIENIAQDIIQLVPALGYSNCTLLAHDWGGIIGWALIDKRPDVFTRYIAMACPNAKRYKELTKVCFDTAKRQWYVVFFLIPWLPEIILSLNGFIFLMRSMTSRRSGVINRKNLTEEDISAFLHSYSQTGAVTPMLNYYRANFSNLLPKKRRGNNTRTTEIHKLTTPTLILWGDRDAFLSQKLLTGHEKFVEKVETKMIADCSHWIQQDCPQIVNGYIREFLETAY